MASISSPKIKFDWYQTETSVTVNILVKNVKPENVRVDIIDKKLLCNGKQSGEEDFSLNLELAHEVEASQVQYKVLSSKIEIKLKKIVGGMWKKLEGEVDEVLLKKNEEIKLYPSSKSEKKDWNKIEQELKKEEAEEKLEGDAALNQLFQKIYADGSEETRKAMNKSFLESGGTVLSTSWNEVGSKTIEMKAPDGMEFKKWE